MADGAVLRVGNTLFVLRYERGARSDAPERDCMHKRLLGQSPESQRARALLSQAARSSEAALLLGPTGAGKELGRGPFTRARQTGLCRRELRGHPANLAERASCSAMSAGVYGADRDQDGFFQQAHRGTLFLDEVGEPRCCKPLLRALQPVEPIGPQLTWRKHPCRSSRGRQRQGCEPRRCAHPRGDQRGSQRRR